MLTFVVKPEKGQDKQRIPCRRYKKWYNATEEKSMTEPVISTTPVIVISLFETISSRQIEAINLTLSAFFEFSM